MVAIEKEKPCDRHTGRKMKKSPPWLWPLLVVSDVAFLLLAAYFLTTKPIPVLVSLVRFIATHFTWMDAGTGALIAFALVLALTKSRRPPEGDKSH
jgi:hypothetical protein